MYILMFMLGFSIGAFVEYRTMARFMGKRIEKVERDSEATLIKLNHYIEDLQRRVKSSTGNGKK